MFAVPLLLGGNIVNYINRGIVYIPIDKKTTKEEMNNIKTKYLIKGQTVVFLREGNQNIKKVISDLLNANL